MILIENIYKFAGEIPAGHDLCLFEKGGDPMDGCVVYGFDEIGEFDCLLQNPQYAFVAQ